MVQQFKHSSIVKEIWRLGSGSAQPQLSVSQLKKLIVILPPIELQIEFSHITKKVETLKLQYQDSLRELENLYGSLSQQAFRGELDLSKVELEETHNFSSEEKLSSSLVLNATNDEIVESLPEDYSSRDDVDASPQFVANSIIAQYKRYHFSFEMLIRFLERKKINYRNYYSSEELKKNPHYDEASDLKAFVFSAIVKNKDDQDELAQANPFIKLEQLFYNAEKENFQLKVIQEDHKLLESRNLKDRSGIYFSIIS